MFPADFSVGSAPTAGRYRRLDDSDSEEDTPTGAPGLILTAAKASELCPKPYRLIARNGNFTVLDDLSRLTQLDYVDLSGNQLRSAQGLGELLRLKTLICRGNALADLSALARLPALTVLNLAENGLTSVEWLAHASFAGSLSTLVVNGNRLANLDGVGVLGALETLVVSNNAIEDLSVVGRLPRLRKLSASHNQIRVIPDSLASCELLSELRVAHNSIARLPGENVMSRLSALRILDLGHNRLTNFDTMRMLSATLQQLNLLGNPVAREQASYPESVVSVCAELQVLDGRRIRGGRRKVRLAREKRAALQGIGKRERVTLEADPAAALRLSRRTEPSESPPADSGQAQIQKIEDKAKRPSQDAIPLDDTLDPHDFVRDAKKKRATSTSASYEEPPQAILNTARRTSHPPRTAKANTSKRRNTQVEGFGLGGASAW